MTVKKRGYGCYQILAAFSWCFRRCISKQEPKSTALLVHQVEVKTKSPGRDGKHLPEIVHSSVGVSFQMAGDMGSTFSLIDRSQTFHSQGAPQFIPSLQPQGETEMGVSECLSFPPQWSMTLFPVLGKVTLNNFLLCFALSFLSQPLPRAKGKEKTTSLEVRCLQGLFL